jgi:hypothetical protein
MASIRFLQRRLRFLSYLLGVFLFSGQLCAENSQQLRWDTYTDQFIETYLTMHAPFAVNAGRHEFDGVLPDWSPNSLTKLKQWLELQRQMAMQYPDSGLKESERFERKYLLAKINEELFWLQSALAPYKNPMFYSGALDPSLYMSRDYAPLDQRMRAFIKYASNVPTATAQIRANLQTPLPGTFIDIGKKVFGGLANFYVHDAKTAFAKVSDPQLHTEFDTIVPKAAKSMLELTAWLEQQRFKETKDFGLGAVLFQKMLETTEGVTLPLDRIEKLGREDLERNLAALNQECHRFVPKLTVKACVEKVETQKPTDGAVAEARRQLKMLKVFLIEKNLISIPNEVEALVAESPPFNRWNPAYIDIPGVFEQNQPSIYYVAPPDPSWNTTEQMAYIPSKANLLFISAHEVWLGHFLQNLHAHRVIKVEQPVTRLPPHRSLRAELPHRALQNCSLCTRLLIILREHEVCVVWLF